MTDTDLIQQIREIVGDRGVLIGDDVSSRSCDPFRQVPAESPVIVRPASTEEVSQVVTLCHRLGQRIVTHGGRTGVSGGAYAISTVLILSLECIHRIANICTTTQLAYVDACVTIEAWQNAMAGYGLCK